MQKIMPCLWFDDRIEEAVNFYTSVFPDAKVESMSRYGDAGPMPKGKVMVAIFTLAGQQFMALNGGPQFKFTEAVSFFVKCADQKEVDYYWNKLTSGGGAESQCGWLKDKFGLSWQIVRCPPPLPQRQGRGEGKPRHAGHAEDAEDRHRRARPRGVGSSRVKEEAM